MKKRINISKLSKRILKCGIPVSVIICVTYIIMTVALYKGTVYEYSKLKLAYEAGEYLLLCIIELTLGAYICERIEKSENI